jgi:hypothetical protein
MVDASSGTNTHTFTVTNVGPRVLYLYGWSTNGGQSADFVVTPTVTTQLASSAGATFKITFNPVTTGLCSTAVFLSNNDPDDDPVCLWLTGRA